MKSPFSRCAVSGFQSVSRQGVVMAGERQTESERCPWGPPATCKWGDACADCGTAGERQTEPHQAVDWHKRAEWIDIREENERLEAEVARLRAERDRERSARHAAERVNAEAVVARRTNLEAQVESERVRAEAAEARVAELEADANPGGQ